MSRLWEGAEGYPLSPLRSTFTLMETTCAICGGDLVTHYRDIPGMPRGGRRLAEMSCPTGCTDTVDYSEARDAAARGESWAPKEPSHCNVSMLKSDPGVVLNGRRQSRFTCQLCRHSEQRDAEGVSRG